MQQHPDSKIRYTLLDPSGVRTSFSGEYEDETAAAIEAMCAAARPLDEGIMPVMVTLTDPLHTPLPASMAGGPLPLDGSAFDAEDTRRRGELPRTCSPSTKARCAASAAARSP
ncbi:hypothetical protein [Pseudofrankia asymbiotica]|uniref:Uncharacterized protein n=1 Tax=Pseudofrankia asymbiotica TaxID=1834516 RepID=A0A1V2IJ38_9ACTN|nr:hypothetical protein [Pseudofrankia asymbiotica]ONH32441.1 hypothetical protein BL253_05270 [Pseudofrankia asymbiotica]